MSFPKKGANSVPTADPLTVFPYVLKGKSPIQSIKYIKNNISNTALSNSLIAQNLGISEVYFRKLFLAKYGTTPKQYILDIRIQKAKQPLRDRKYKITSVSDECGFSSQYHFCRIFKEKTGYTPSDYSKSFKNILI